MRRAQFLLIVATVAAFALIFTANAPAAEPKRILLVQSFGSAATPFTARLMAFETELIAKMGDRVDLDEVSLDTVRYEDRDIQEAIINYLQKRQAKWQPDLVVPIGSSATIFVGNYRDRLFPETPILYVVDRRLLPPGALEKNAAYIGQEIDLPGSLEDMLQVAPATKNIAVIVGATPLEHYWQEAFQKAAEPLAGRINFTYYSDLSFEQMKERVSTLPPNSYIFFLVLVRDAAGVTLNADGALQRLHAVAHAPSIPSSSTNWAWGSWVGAFTRARGSERRLRTSPFVFCMVNQLPVFLQDCSSASPRIMTGASCSDGKLMRNSCRQEARSCSAGRRFGIATARGS